MKHMTIRFYDTHFAVIKKLDITLF